MGPNKPVEAPSGPVGKPLSETALLRLLKQASSDLGTRSWIVGGYVRDKLLGREQLNPDVVVEGDGPRLARRFAELSGAPAPIPFERFGTAQVTLPGRLVEFVSARSESYPSDSRKPVVRPASLDEDLRRRDFTVNTLLMDLDGRIEDRLGAMADFEARMLRTPADPALTFTDDPLRMLRGIRLAAVLGFSLAPNLIPAMREHAYRLGPPVISAERISDELRRMLTSERPKLALELLDETGLLERVLPELAACKGVRQGGYHTHDVFGHSLLTVAGTGPDLSLRLAAAFHDVGKPATATPDGAFPGHDEVGAILAAAAMERLRFSQKEIDTVVTLVRLHLRPVYYSSQWTDGAVRRLARDAGPRLAALMELARADIAASAYPEPEKMDELQARLDAVLAERPSRIAAPISGDDIMRALGIPPGPEVGRIKAKLEELVMDAVLPPKRDAMLEYLRAHPKL